MLPASAFSQFRVIGYVSAWAQSTPRVSDSALQKLTHLNIAFINPDSSGNLIVPAGIDSLIQQAHASKVTVLLSVGGGTFNPYYATLLGAGNRKIFVDKLLQLAADLHADGIDADLEGDAIDKNYEAFITDLSAGLKPAHKLLTAAFANWNAQLISDIALRQFDFINVMSYDHTGPWRPNEPGPHATYEMSVADLAYWTNKRGVPKNKINLGVPFYGYCFATRYGESMSYGNILATFPDAALQDLITPADGGAIYYNGLSTIQKKTSMAIKDAGGIMIWQIMQDAAGDQSLLTAINTIVKKASMRH